MQYLFLIYNDETKLPSPPEDPKEREQWMAPWNEYTAALQEAGVMLGANPLQPTSTATTVSASEKNELVFTDGPFAETKEQLGGYFLVECSNLDEALHWAGKCPGVHLGRVEVRPIANLMG